jgi:hypothetical protein
MPCIRSWFHVRSGYTESTVGYCSPRYGPHCLEWEWLVCRREEQIKMVAGPRFEPTSGAFDFPPKAGYRYSVGGVWPDNPCNSGKPKPIKVLIFDT